MKRKIISMLMVMVILFTTVDVSAFASEVTISGNEVQSAVEGESSYVEIDDSEGILKSVSENKIGEESEEQAEDSAEIILGNESEGDLEEDNNIPENDEENMSDNEILETVSGNELENNNELLISMNQIESVTTNIENGEIKIGDYITLGTYYGEKILWRCVDIDENGPLMLSDKILCMKAFDANGSSNYHYVDIQWFRNIRAEYGSNCYKDSNLRQWLNSTEEAVSWTHNPPAKGNVANGYNAYSDEVGFLSIENFTEKELECIKEVTQKIYTNEAEAVRGVIDGGSREHGVNDNNLTIMAQDYNFNDCYYQNVTDKIFIPTLAQIRKIYINFNNGEYVKAKPTKNAVEKSDYVNANLAEDKYYEYWINHAGTAGYSYEHNCTVASSGVLSALQAYQGFIGIRPAFYLDMAVFQETEGEGSIENPFYTDFEVSGKCGDNLTWMVVGDTLTISGTGDMWDYGYEDMGMGEYIESPWKEYDNISTIKIESGITRIGDYAFNGYKNLTGDLVIPEGVTSIGESAFSGCIGFTGSLILPDTITNIGMNAFAGCKGFTGELKIPAGITEITHGAFNQCSGFSGDLVIPEGVKVVGWASFNGCTGFKGNLILPESLTTIEDNAFGACSGFTGKLEIPKGMKVIGSYVFAGCSGFTGELLIPENVTNIGPRAFWQCSGFTGDLNLSEYVVWIGESAFAECSGLSGTAYIRGELENIGENAFTTITKIYGRAGTLVETYAKNNSIVFEELDDLPIQTIVTVDTAADLMKISSNVSKGVTDYKGKTIEITQDIDLSSETWVPIGNTSRPFRGNIQGNGCTISGIRCNDVYGGLIGCWASQESSYIDNLIVEDMQLTGKRSGGIVANLWVDENEQADISNVTVKGTINGISLISGGVVGAISGNGKVQIAGCNIDVSMNSGPMYNDNYGCIGGVVGSATDSGSGELIISSCIVNGNITTEQTYSYCSSEAGGIIGLSKVKTLKIEQCSKKGQVSCKAYYAHTGGFIGSAEIRADSSLTISDSYVNADITSTCTNGNSQSGGFIGHTTGTGGNPIEISNSYVTGSMSADNKAAFVCWYSEYVCPTIQNCYFDMAKLGLSKNHMVCRLTTFSKDWLSDNITNSGGLSTLEMKIVDNYANWNFDNVWGMPAVFNEGYPALRIENFEEDDNEQSEPQETIVDIVKKYVSGEEIKVLNEILNNPTLSDEAKVDKLSNYFHYDNVFDMREHITQLNNTHKERQGYEGLICDELYLSWQYYYYLNHTPKGTAARLALAASGLVFNGEINDLIDPGTYLDGDYPGVQKYKTLLEQFIQQESTSIEAWSYAKEAESFISSLTDVCTDTEKAQVIKQLRKAPSLVECESIFNDFIAAKVDKDTILEFKGEKPLFIEAMDYTGTTFKIIDMTMDAFSDLVDISSNIATYEMYHNFLQDIIDSNDLPWEMVVAAYQLDRELQQAYWTPIEKVLIEMRDVCLGEAFNAAKFKNILDKNGFLTAVNFSAFCINQLVDVGELVVNSCHTEGYAFLAMHYKNKLINSKNQFIESPTEENAWAFYESYIMLWKLRLAGEEKFLQMSQLQGGDVVDGLSEAVAGGTIAGLISECCGYADKKQAVDKNKKMLQDLKFSYAKKSTGIPQEYKYLQKIVVACPVSVEFLDENNNIICSLEDKIEQTIENEHGKFMSIYSVASGDYVKIAYLKKNTPYQVRIVGQESGKVTYSIAKTNDHVNYSLEGFDNVVVDKNSIIQTKTDSSLYTIDLDGDGEINQEREHVDKNKVYVQFDYQDGQRVLVEYVDENGLVVIPEEPVREGYIFEGWFIDVTDIESKFVANTEVNESITVYAKWKEKTKLPVPSSNVNSGNDVEEGTKIILSCQTEGAQIYYSLDESEPTQGSLLYTQPIEIQTDVTIKAIAVKTGCENSEVATFVYRLKISEDNPDFPNEDDKKEDETPEDNKQEGGNIEGSNIEEKEEIENNNDIVFNVQLGESKPDELEYSKFSLKENGKIKAPFVPNIKENDDVIQNEIVAISDEGHETNEQSVHNEESNGDITNDIGGTEDDTSTDTEKNGLGTVTMGAIIIVLGVVFIYGRNKRRKH